MFIDLFSNNFIKFSTIFGDVIDLDNGEYNVSFTPTVSGFFQINIKLQQSNGAGKPISSSPFQLEVLGKFFKLLYHSYSLFLFVVFFFFFIFSKGSKDLLIQKMETENMKLSNDLGLMSLRQQDLQLEVCFYCFCVQKNK